MAANRSTEPESPLFEGDWNNRKCIEIAFSDHFPSCVKDVNIQKDIITRYLNFYLGGRPQKGLSVTDLAFAVISIMPVHEETETFLWRDMHYKERGAMFFLTPEDKLKAEVGNIKLDEVNLRENFIHKAPIDDNMDVDDFDGSNSSNEYKHDSCDTGKDNADERSVQDVKTIPELLSRLNTLIENQVNEEKLNKDTFKPIGSNFYNLEEHMQSSAFKLPTNIQWFSKARVTKQKEAELNLVKYGPVENSAFTASCNRLLGKWETNEKARIVLKYFFGIVALILMRGTTKKYPHLVNVFAGSKFFKIVSGFLCGNLNYCTPHKKCFKNSFRTFRKRDGKIPVMFAKIVVESFHIDTLLKQPAMMPINLNILKYAILSHTADFGFGLVGMLQNMQAQGLNIDRIIAATYCKETEKSWHRLKRFLETYMVKKSKEATHHWARVISTNFFRDLCCNANYELSVILGIFIEKATGNCDVWQSAWVKSDVHVRNLENLKETGIQMYKTFMKLGSN